MTDSDWAADRETRQSVSCGAIMVNGNLVQFQSKRQQSIALGSCEAETIAATSSRQLIARKGLGKARHLDVDFLWIQKIKGLVIKAIKGKDNPADLGTRSLSRDKIRKYMVTIGHIGDYLDQEVQEEAVEEEEF